MIGGLASTAGSYMSAQSTVAANTAPEPQIDFAAVAGRKN
jgi:hypothetical protein